MSDDDRCILNDNDKWIMNDDDRCALIHAKAYLLADNAWVQGWEVQLSAR